MRCALILFPFDNRLQHLYFLLLQFFSLPDWNCLFVNVVDCVAVCLDVSICGSLFCLFDWLLKNRMKVSIQHENIILLQCWPAQAATLSMHVQEANARMKRMAWRQKNGRQKTKKTTCLRSKQDQHTFHSIQYHLFSLCTTTTLENRMNI